MQVLNQCFAIQYQIDGDLVLAAMHDGTSVNGAALCSLAVLYPNMFGVVCFSHTANNAGKHFNFPVLELFRRLWISLFSHSASWHGRRIMLQRFEPTLKQGGGRSGKCIISLPPSLATSSHSSRTTFTYQHQQVLGYSNCCKMKMIWRHFAFNWQQ